MAKETSEFGKGLTYCLGLFLAHSERAKMETERDIQLWFNGAADHFYDMVIPETMPNDLISRLTILRNKSLNWRLNDNPTQENKEWALQEARTLLFRIDKHFGIPAIRAQWE